MRAGRLVPRLVIAALLVALAAGGWAVLRVVGAEDRVHAERALPAAASGGDAVPPVPVEVTATAPEQAEQLRIAPVGGVPAVPGPGVGGMSGVRLLAAPARITAARPWSGRGIVRFTYDESSLPQAPPGAEPGPYGTGSLVVLTRPEGGGEWKRVDATVDPRTSTVTARTAHFSDWAIGVTDPEVLRAEVAEHQRLSQSDGGRLAGFLWGSTKALTCSPDRLLVAVRTRTVQGAVLDACQEVLDDGTYRLSLVNRAGIPLRLTLPEGYEVEVGPGPFQVDDSKTWTFTESDTDSLSAAIAAKVGTPEGTTAIGPGLQTALTFDGEAVKEGLVLTAQPDYLYGWMRWFSGYLKVAGQELNSEQIDRLVLGLKSADCMGKVSAGLTEKAGDDVSERWQQSEPVVKEHCQNDLYGVALDIFAENFADADGKGFVNRLKMLLDAKGWLDLAREEMNLLFHVGGAKVNPYYQDMRSEVQPTRVMTKEEAFRLPLVQRTGGQDPEDSDDSATCVVPPAGAFPPAGAPAWLPPARRADTSMRKVTCLRALELDLDGNDRPDRLVTWAAGGSRRPGTTLVGEDARPLKTLQLRAVYAAGGSVSEMERWTGVPDPDGPFYGMAAYLDDESWHVLEDADAVATWEIDPGFGPAPVGYLSPVRAVQSAGSREAALVGFATGANTRHAVLVGLSGDDRLRVARRPTGAVADLVSGGGATAPSGFGCVVPADASVPGPWRGRRLLAETSVDAPGVQPPAVRRGTVLSMLSTPPKRAGERVGGLALTPVAWRGFTVTGAAATRAAERQPWRFRSGRGCAGPPGSLEGPLRRASPAPEGALQALLDATASGRADLSAPSVTTGYTPSADAGTAAAQDPVDAVLRMPAAAHRAVRAAVTARQVRCQLLAAGEQAVCDVPVTGPNGRRYRGWLVRGDADDSGGWTVSAWSEAPSSSA